MLPAALAVLAAGSSVYEGRRARKDTKRSNRRNQENMAEANELSRRHNLQDNVVRMMGGHAPTAAPTVGVPTDRPPPATNEISSAIQAVQGELKRRQDVSQKEGEVAERQTDRDDRKARDDLDRQIKLIELGIDPDETDPDVIKEQMKKAAERRRRQMGAETDRTLSTAERNRRVDTPPTVESSTPADPFDIFRGR